MAAKAKRRSTPHPLRQEEISKTEISEVEIGPTPLPWFTLETLLYAAIFVLAVGLRLSNLGAYPLSNAEAEQSLPALVLYRGGLPQPGHYSPLLLSLNTLTFLLFGASDVSARLAPVLLGSALVLLPFTLRRYLGPLACLFTSALLTISPVAIFLSRTLNSEIAVATGALTLVAGFLNWTEEGQQHWLLLIAAGLALLLVAGPMAYSVLLVFGLIVLVKYSTFKALWVKGLENSSRDQLTDHPSPGTVTASSSPLGGNVNQASLNNPASATNPQGRDTPAQPHRERASAGQLSKTPVRRAGATVQSRKSLSPDLRNAGIFFVIVMALLATTATFNLSGFGVAATLFVDWLNHFGFQARPEAGFNAVFLLTIYEPLLVAAGLTGIAYAILRKNFPESLLVGWFLGLLLLDVLLGGRPNGNVILPLLPLAFLAAISLAELWEGVRQWGAWSNEGILLAAGLVIAGFGYIGLTGWIIRTCSPDDRFCQLSWLQSVAALALFFVVVAFFGFIGDARSALRGAALTGLAVGLLATIGIGWRLNFGPLMHLAYQPLAGIPASTELVQLTETLAGQSEARAGDATALDTTLVGTTGPALRWRLRNYGHLTQARSVFESPLATAIITPASPDRELEADEPYIGQDFALDAIWSPVGLPPKELMKWLIYRQSNERPEGNKAVLWLRVAEQ